MVATSFINLAVAVITTLYSATGSSAQHQPLKAIAIISAGTAKSGIRGVVKFTEGSGCTVFVDLDISNLEPNSVHGFHIHELGDVSDEENPCGSTGGHFNPNEKTHGSPIAETRHVGDLGNIVANEKGVASINIEDSRIALTGANSIIGRAVVVHAQSDDLGQGGNEGSLKTGNAGGRIGCGIIGIAKH